MSRTGQLKGAEAEREVARLAQRAGFKKAHRTAPMQAGKPKEYPDVGGIPGVWLEVKRGRRVHVGKHARVYLKPAKDLRVLVWREDRGDWYAGLRLADLFRLLRDR